jgi:hypothetical protein
MHNKFLKLNFIKSAVENNKSIKSKLILFVNIYLKLYIFVIISLVLSGFLDLIINHFYGFSINEIIRKKQYEVLFRDKYLYNIFYILVLGPIVEELIFRLPLIIKKENLSISLILLCLLFVGGNLSSLTIIWFSFFLKLGSIIFIILFITYLDKKNILKQINDKYYTHYFYFLCSAFALMHISNFYSVFPKNLVLLCPLYVLPQFFLAYFSGFLRLKNGFLWGILLHFLFNLPAALIYIF